jgi:hypothetical protein
VKLSPLPAALPDQVLLDALLRSMLGIVPECDATFTIHMLHARVAGEVGISILATAK